MKRIASLLLFVAVSAFLSAAEPLFTVTPIADGVYAAVATAQYKTNCNAMIIVLDDSVLVVDTHSKPSAARALIEEIKKITNKPVRFVVNTHFHWDHTQGGQAYPATWPSNLEIISSERTRENIEQRGIPRVKTQLLAAPKDIYRIKGEIAKATDPKVQAKLQDDLKQAEGFYEELKQMQLQLPTLTFERSMVLHRGSRTVQFLYLGNAHTEGDIWVYLPKEKILACGDALHGWVPFMSDSYPYDWIKTLEAVEKLDFEHFLGGHGGVFHGRDQIKLWKSYLTDLIAETTSSYTTGATMNEVVAQVMPKLTAKYGTRFPDFTQRAPGNVEKVWRVIGGETK
jgi:cyclase